MGYCLNRLDEPVFMAVPKPLLTEFGIHYRLESCGLLCITCKKSSKKLKNEGLLFKLCTTPDVSKHWLISWIILGYSLILVYYSVSYSLICIQFIICWQIVCKWAELYANEASCSAAVFPASAQYFYDLFFLLSVLELFFIPTERQSRRNLKSFFCHGWKTRDDIDGADRHSF